MIDCVPENVFNIFSYLVILGILDQLGTTLMSKYDDSIRWFYLHSFTNFFTTIVTFKEMFLTLAQTGEGLYFNEDVSPIAANITLALHLYHFIFFKSLRKEDLIHHTSMIGTMLIVNIYRGGSITNYLIFYLNGLPGLINYLCLLLVKFGRMDRYLERKISVYVNVWLRCPGILYGCSILWLYWRFGYLNYISTLPVIFNLVTSFWNGPYYTKEVVYSYGVMISHRETMDAIRSNYTSVIYLASSFGEACLVKFLASRLTPDDLRKEDNACLISASGNGHIGVLKVLIDYGLTIEDIRTKDNLALRSAAKEGHIDVVQFLIDRGLTIQDIRAVDNQALEMAFRRGHMDIVKILIEKGLDERDAESIEDIKIGEQVLDYMRQLNKSS